MMPGVATGEQGRAMRITFVLPGGGRSGGVRCTVVAGNHLVERGHTVRIIYQREPLVSRGWLHDQWLRIRYPGGGQDWLGTFKGTLEPMDDLGRCQFTPGEFVIGAGVWSCRALNKVTQEGVHKVHYLHGQIPWDRPAMMAAWGEPVPKIAVASYLDSVVNDLCSQHVYAVVPNGVDPTEYFPSAGDRSRTAVGTVFGKGRHKDPETVLAVLEKLSVICPDVPQVVFGADPCPKALVGRNYVRLPSVAEARKLYSSSLVWFLASCSEGFPAPILEAMRCGCAVVSTDCGGPRDVIQDGVNGFLTPVGDVNGIADRIHLLLNNRAVREQMVASAFETVGRFTWESSVDLLEGALESIHRRSA
jgi:glycosyltransferase involved in cell wall biosynthesis